MGLWIPLPHTKKGPYPANFWMEFEKELTYLRLKPSINTLENIILKNANMRPGSTNPFNELSNLRKVLKKDDEPLIAFIADLALSLPDLFPEGHLKCLERQLSEERKQLTEKVKKGRAVLFKSKVELMRYQVASLLSLMFFCAIFPWKEKSHSHRGHFTGVKASTGNDKKPRNSGRNFV